MRRPNDESMERDMVKQSGVNKRHNIKRESVRQ